MDICIRIIDHKFTTKVFDKRDSFGFNFPFLCGNIPVQSAYGVYISQLVRIGRICDRFLSGNYMITSKLIRQGSDIPSYAVLLRSLLDDIVMCSKFKHSVKNHIWDGVCLPVGALSHLTAHVTSRHVRTNYININLNSFTLYLAIIYIYIYIYVIALASVIFLSLLPLVNVYSLYSLSQCCCYPCRYPL